MHPFGCKFVHCNEDTTPPRFYGDVKEGLYLAISAISEQTYDVNVIVRMTVASPNVIARACVCVCVSVTPV